MRSVLLFNDDWLYAPEELPLGAGDDQFAAGDAAAHQHRLLPHHNFDNLDYQFISTYRKRFTLPEPRNGRRLYVDFDGAMIAATVSINGRVLGEHDGGYMPFSFDLTDYLTTTARTCCNVRLEFDRAPGHSALRQRGRLPDLRRHLPRRASALRRAVHIADVFVRPHDVLTERRRLEIDVVPEKSAIQLSAA